MNVISLKRVENNYCHREKLLFMSHNVFKSHLPRMHRNEFLVGKGLTTLKNAECHEALHNLNLTFSVKNKFAAKYLRIEVHLLSLERVDK